MKRFVWLVTAAVLTGSMAFAADMPKVGDKAPEFSVAASDGTTAHLKALLSKSLTRFALPSLDTLTSANQPFLTG